MWTYSQSTGFLLDKEGVRQGIGYSGHDKGKNNPHMQDVHNVGPLPCGMYLMGIPCDTATHGPYVIPLTPDPTNEMFGRSGFLVHGDSIRDPGTASHGCIILPNTVRHKLWASGDTLIQVIP